MIRKLVIWLQPFIQWLGRLRIPFSRKRITGKEYYEMRDKIKPGAILLTSTCGELSNLINPSEFKHGAIYIGGDTVKYVLEATGKGITMTDLVTFMLQKDKICVMEPELEQEAKDVIVSEATKYIGRPYDFAFKFDNEEYYCFEFIAMLFEKYSRYDVLDKYIVLGYEAYTSETFSKDHIRFYQVVRWG